MTYGYSGEVLLAGGGERPRPIPYACMRPGWSARRSACPRRAISASTCPPAGPPPRPRRRCSPPPRPPCRGPRRGRRRSAPDGTLTVAGDGISPASVQRRLVHPRRRPTPCSARRRRRSAVRRAGVHAGADAGRGVPARRAARRRAGGARRRRPARPRSRSPPRRAARRGGRTDLLGRLLGFAFLGGLILNLMPCVFPVLAMKAVALAGLSGAARRSAVAQALSYTAGVVATFPRWAPRCSGCAPPASAAGWGFQFQSPAFVAGDGLGAVRGRAEPVRRVRGAVGASPGRASRWPGAAGTSAASSPACWPCWWRRPARRRSWGWRSAPRWRPAAGADHGRVRSPWGWGWRRPMWLLAALPGFVRLLPRPGRVDGTAAPGAGLPDVRAPPPGWSG